jgi:hypothetical protein
MFCSYRARFRSGEMLNSNMGPGIFYSSILGALPKSLRPTIVVSIRAPTSATRITDHRGLV